MRNRFLTLAENTPAGRDRYIDFLRAMAIITVVFGHWFMAVPSYENGSFSATNALSSLNGLWIITWIFQVMPLFFFVGGLANASTLNQSGAGYGQYMVSRFRRLVRPVLVLLAVWTLVTLAMTGAGLTSASISTITKWITQPLWFVAAYLTVTALAPVMIRSHHKYGVHAPILLTVSIIGVDYLRFGVGLELLGAVNFVLVWLFAQQLGFFYADRSLQRWGRSGHLTMALGGLAALVVLVSQFGYPGSMVGQAGDRFSNMSPPTAAIAALAVMQVGVAMLIRNAAARQLAKPRRWAMVIATNTFAMTIYLWHLTALIAAVVVTYPLGLPQFAAGTPMWLATRPVWFAIVAVFLVALVVIFSRFDSVGKRSKLSEQRRLAPGVAIATVTTSLAILVLALTSLDGVGSLTTGRPFGPLDLNPTLALAVIVLSAGAVEVMSRTGESKARLQDQALESAPHVTKPAIRTTEEVN